MNNNRIIKSVDEQNKYYLKDNKKENKEISNIKSNKYALHPISSLFVKNRTDSTECLTSFYYSDDKLNISKNYRCKNIQQDIKDIYILPPIGLLSDDIVKIYNVETIDKLFVWFNKSIDDIKSDNHNTINYLTIIKIINCWVRVNFDTLKNYNNFLVKIISKLFNLIFNNEYDIPKIDDKINKYINFWIKNHSESDYNLNIIDDFNNYIIKKTKLKSK